MNLSRFLGIPDTLTLIAFAIPALAGIYRIVSVYRKSHTALSIGRLLSSSAISIAFVVIWSVSGIMSTILVRLAAYPIIGYAPESEMRVVAVGLIGWSLAGAAIGLSDFAVYATIWVGLITTGVAVFCGFIISFTAAAVLQLLEHLGGSHLNYTDAGTVLRLALGIGGFLWAFALPTSVLIGSLAGLSGTGARYMLRSSGSAWLNGVRPQ